MKNKLKNAARFVLENFFLTLAVMLLAGVATILLFTSTAVPAYTTGFGAFVVHVLLALVYLAAGWDLHRWVEQRERRKWQKEWKR